MWGTPRGGWGPPKPGAVGEKGTPIALYIYIIYTYRTGWGGGVWPPPAPQKHPNSWGRRGTGIKGEEGETKASLGLAPAAPSPGPPTPGAAVPPTLGC